jgi:hypothetical protein
MKLTDALLGEHGVLYALFDHIEATLADAKALAEVQRTAEILGAALAGHAAIEDDILFPALDQTIGPDGPLAVMRHEHEEVHRMFGEIAAGGELAEAATLVRSLIDLAREHFAKEEQVLFTMSQQALGDDKLEELGHGWSKARRVYIS